MIYEYWLAGIKEITDLKKLQLRAVYGSGNAIYYIELRFLNEKDVAILKNAKKDTKLEEKWRRTEEKRIQFIPYFLKTYPEKLKYITDPPYALYVLGQLPDEKRKSAAIVGARNCTAYGEQMALQYGKGLAEAGIQIISGMARGIVGAGQRGALNSSWAKESGVTYAVLGCGPDICYPMQNRDLYQNLLKNGGVLSEYPPGSSPLPFHFPMRNRIISGLSDLVIVIEAREKSGSLITADQALEQGRDVMVLPGRAGDALSAGCNRLIDQGAGIFLSTDQILERLKIKKKNHTNTKKTYIALESEENLVYSVLEFQAKNLQSIADETNLTPQKVSAILVRLMLCGLVAEDVKNHYSKV